MAQTEQDLRDALRGLSADPPEVTNLVGRVERGLRRRRIQEVAVALVLVVLIALPLLRLLPDRVNGDPVLPADPGQEQMDARMQYAAFVAWWDGHVVGGETGSDLGVKGVVVTTTLPPFACAVASMAPGQPPGSQAAWVLGSGAVLGHESPWPGTPQVTTAVVLWDKGLTSCAGAPEGETVVSSPVRSLVTGDVAFSQEFSDTTRPALDVAGVYRSITPDQVTAHGREVFAAYEAKRASLDFGTPVEQTDRALASLAEWVSVGVSTESILQSPPQAGPVVLDMGIDRSTLNLPAGFSVRWIAAFSDENLPAGDPDNGRFCVDGGVAGSPVRHVDTDSYQGDTLPVVGDGACP
jgi:hypothetical protein